MAAASSSSTAPAPSSPGAAALPAQAPAAGEGRPEPPLVAGCQVFVREAFEYPEYQLAKDLLGVVLKIDGCGDVFINWQVVGKKWVLKRDLFRIGVKQVVQSPSAAQGPEKAIPTFTFKTIVVGGYSVGKSSLALRFVKGVFKQGIEPTIGATFMTQTVFLDDMKVKLEIWDTAGQERYKSLAPIYFRGAAATIVVYDISNKASYDAARTWVQEIREEAQSTSVFLVGNKKDLGAQQRKTPRADAEKYAEEANLMYMETSAKTGENVDATFRKVAMELRRVQREEPQAGGGRQRAHVREIRSRHGRRNVVAEAEFSASWGSRDG
ncbi:unnamed protein product [Prorocentrum cordatum]|uniref:Ras-related protein Rab-5C n=1 Tax=Prorocentrum cordatum TaxID=2364126 RepID=A0ABN9XPP8_9DINO|nr:unnamed protein product [Polarella glacialis]